MYTHKMIAKSLQQLSVGHCRRSLTTGAVQSFRNGHFVANRALVTNVRSFSTSFSDEDDALAAKLCQAALKKVPDYGWTDDAIVAAAEELSSSGSYSISISGLVDPGKLIHYYMQQCNEELREQLDKRSSTVWQVQSTTLVDCIIEAIQIRLSMQKEFIKSERWHEGMALGAQPQNFLTTRAQLHDLVDIIAEAVAKQQNGSDEITPIEHFGLGSVYVATELHMLADNSFDYVDTWNFLRARVENWEMLRNNTGRVAAMIPLPPQLSVAKTLGSSLFGGLASVMSPKSAVNFGQFTQNLKTPPEYLWSALVYIQQQKGTTAVSTEMDGTHPSHYTKK